MDFIDRIEDAVADESGCAEIRCVLVTAFSEDGQILTWQKGYPVDVAGLASIALQRIINGATSGCECSQNKT